jgi:hypothetical protein
MTSSDLDIAHLNDLKKTYIKHLQILQKQEASFGSLYCPPHIILSIADVQEKIDNINAEINRAQGPQDDSDRRPPLKNELDDFVTHHLSRQVANKLEFTAYDVTLAFRRQHADVNVIHRDVRRSVHLQMRLLVALGDYQLIWVLYGEAKARRYIPKLANTQEE